MVTVVAKKFLLNRAHILRRVRRAKERELKKIGGFARTTERRLFRRPGKRSKSNTSKPGSPPKHHTKLKNTVFFAVDVDGDWMVIGPKWEPTQSQTIPAPQLLNEGGTGRISSDRKNKKYRVSIYKPRPYRKKMIEILLAKKKIPQRFKNSIRPY